MRDPPPKRYAHFDVLVELAWLNDPDKYTHGRIATAGSPMPDRSQVIAQTKGTP